MDEEYGLLYNRLKVSFRPFLAEKMVTKTISPVSLLIL